MLAFSTPAVPVGASKPTCARRSPSLRREGVSYAAVVAPVEQSKSVVTVVRDLFKRAVSPWFTHKTASPATCKSVAITRVDAHAVVVAPSASVDSTPVALSSSPSYAAVVLGASNPVNNSSVPAVVQPAPVPANATTPIVVASNAAASTVSYTSPLPLASKRAHILREFVSTETSLASDLGLVVEAYLSPEALASCPLSKEDVAAVFLNIRSVAELSADFVKRLEAATSPAAADVGMDNVGETFLFMMNRLRVAYTSYAMQQQAAQALIVARSSSPAYAAWFARCWAEVKPHTATWDLASLHIKPAQRVLRYKDLLERLIKATSAVHDDFECLERALAEMVALADSVERGIAAVEQFNAERAASSSAKSSLWAKLEKHQASKSKRPRKAVDIDDIRVDSPFAAPPASPPPSPVPSDPFEFDRSPSSSFDSPSSEDLATPSLSHQASNESLSSSDSSIKTGAASTFSSATDNDPNVLGLFGLAPLGTQGTVELASDSETDDNLPSPAAAFASAVKASSAFDEEVQRARKVRALALTGSLPGGHSRPKPFVRKVSPLNPAQALRLFEEAEKANPFTPTSLASSKASIHAPLEAKSSLKIPSLFKKVNRPVVAPGVTTAAPVARRSHRKATAVTPTISRPVPVDVPLYGVPVW